jgi:hypothetical protein
MKRILATLVFCVLCSGSAVPQSSDLSLVVSASGNAYATWKSHEGLPDRFGSANFGLEMEKNTTEVSAVYVTVLGVSGKPVSFLTEGTGLSFEHRNDGFCGHVPVWVVPITGKSGATHKLAIRCYHSLESQGSAPGWTKHSFSASRIRELIFNQFGSVAEDVLEGKINDLFLFFNEPMSFVFIDNLRVNQTVWTSPMDDRARGK